MKNTTTRTVTNTITKSSPVKKLKASKECRAPTAHSSRLVNPRIPKINHPMSIIVTANGVDLYIKFGRLPNAIKGMEAKTLIRTTMQIHTIEVYIQHPIIKESRT